MDITVYKNFLLTQCLEEADSAHDIAHIQRVVKSALELSEMENADIEIVTAAAWLHDCVTLPKNHPDRKKASQLAAEKAAGFLNSINFPPQKIDAVSHAIEAHSFSAGIPPKTIEAKIVQDADRLDALGAIGIARCFLVGGAMNSTLYNVEDPFCENREPNDKAWSIDHFYKKLFTLPKTMNTESGKRIAELRVEFMKEYLDQLRREIDQ